MIEAPEDLVRLRQSFVDAGFDLRFVGGCVRDSLMGIEPKDFDLCTDANPFEQLAIYNALDLPSYLTGMDHGTISVRLDSDLYEITSLRRDVECDGRHAQVEYTTDWDADLARRDLTINAMAQTFAGELIDPFGGRNDLAQNRVVFVGKPEDRMQEDYLRILRWIRFHGRFGYIFPLDFHTQLAAMDLAKGLATVSRERIWMEMAKIATGPRAGYLLHYVGYMGLWEPMGVEAGFMNTNKVAELQMAGVTDPVTMFVGLFDTMDRVEALADHWRWSRAEKNKAMFLAKEFYVTTTSWRWLLAYDRVSKDWVIDLLRLRGDIKDIADVVAWDVPTFPVQGRDLIQEGMEPGAEMGRRLAFLRYIWAVEGFVLDKDALIKMCEAA